MKYVLFFSVLVALSIAGCKDITGQDVQPTKASAVVIGVENGFAGKCSGALKDANDMSELLRQHSSEITILKDKTATASAVVAAMEKSVDADLAIIYFSGHGGSASSSDSFETDGKDEYICCYDKGLLDDDIWRIISGSKGRVFLIFDCCHSETMFKAPVFASRARRVSASGSVPNMLCWSGCPDSSYSYGSSAGGEFTTAIRKYASSDRTYAEVWKKINEDGRLKSQQAVKSTEFGDFGSGNTKIFR